MQVRIDCGPRIPEHGEQQCATPAGARGDEQIGNNGCELQARQTPTSLPELTEAGNNQAEEPSGERTVRIVPRWPRSLDNDR
jgi:hypothetical protein